MTNKQYFTPSVADLTPAPRDIDILDTFGIVSSTNALIDRKQVFNKIGESQAQELFDLARRSAVETVTLN